MAFVGQLLAYLGIGTLTVGTVIVIVNHFGGTTNAGASGWLISVVGQMLLLLGIVTLVSGGIEQTSNQLTGRLDALANDLNQRIPSPKKKYRVDPPEQHAPHLTSPRGIVEPPAGAES